MIGWQRSSVLYSVPNVQVLVPDIVSITAVNIGSMLWIIFHHTTDCRTEHITKPWNTRRENLYITVFISEFVKIFTPRPVFYSFSAVVSFLLLRIQFNL